MKSCTDRQPARRLRPSMFLVIRSWTKPSTSWETSWKPRARTELAWDTACRFWDERRASSSACGPLKPRAWVNWSLMRWKLSVAVFRPDCRLSRAVSVLRRNTSAPARAVCSPTRAASSVTTRAVRAASSAALFCSALFCSLLSLRVAILDLLSLDRQRLCVLDLWPRLALVVCAVGDARAALHYIYAAMHKPQGLKCTISDRK